MTVVLNWLSLQMATFFVHLLYICVYIYIYIYLYIEECSVPCGVELKCIRMSLKWMSFLVASPSFTRMRSSGNWNVYSVLLLFYPLPSWSAEVEWLIALSFTWLVFEMINQFRCRHFEIILDLSLRTVALACFYYAKFFFQTKITSFFSACVGSSPIHDGPFHVERSVFWFQFPYKFW